MLNSRELACSMLFCLGLVLPARAVEFTYETLDAFGGDVYPSAIDNQGKIVGQFVASGRQAGFTGSIAAGFTEFSLPGFDYALPLGINDAGDLVGVADPSQGFLREADSDVIPLGKDNLVTEINNLGQVVMNLLDESGDYKMYLREPDGNLKELVNPPGVAELLAYGINDHGLVSGHATPLNPEGSFILDTIDGDFELFKVSGAATTQASQINNLGMVVGRATFFPNTPEYYEFGFVRMPSGKFFEVAPPGGELFNVYGINDMGQIVGSYLAPGDPRILGFLATPAPEPSSCVLAAIGLSTLVMASRRRRI